MIRRADYDDINELIRLSKNCCDASGMPFDKGHMIKVCRNNLVDWNKLVLVSPLKDGTLSGMLAGCVVPWMPSPNYYMAMEMCFWVEPDFRYRGVGKALIEGYIEWAQNVDCKRIMFHSLLSVDPEGSDRLYKKFGLVPHEMGYVLED